MNIWLQASWPSGNDFSDDHEMLFFVYLSICFDDFILLKHFKEYYIEKKKYLFLKTLDDEEKKKSHYFYLLLEWQEIVCIYS